MSTVNKFDWLSADQLKAELPRGAVIGREIIVLEQTSSTNDAVSRVASTGGLPSRLEGLVVFAEHQTAGRGQRGNKWESARYKGLWFSILLRPGIEVEDSARLTSWAAQTVASTIRSNYSLPAEIKLPNDVYITGRKVAGVLIEMRARPQSA